jgi:hypothetical protein
MRGGDSRGGQLLPAMRNSGECRANRACVRTAKRPAAGRPPRDPRAFRIAATPGVRRVLAEGGCLFDGYHPRFPRSWFDRVLLSIHVHQISRRRYSFADFLAATYADRICHHDDSDLVLLHAVRGFGLAGHAGQTSHEALRRGPERTTRYVRAGRGAQFRENNFQFDVSGGLPRCRIHGEEASLARHSSQLPGPAQAVGKIIGRAIPSILGFGFLCGFAARLEREGVEGD